MLLLLLLLLRDVLVVLVDQSVLGVVLGVRGVQERVWPCALLHGVRGIVQTVASFVHSHAFWLRQLLQLILELLNVLILLSFLITVRILEEVGVLVVVVLREEAFGLDLVVVLGLMMLWRLSKVALGVQLVAAVRHLYMLWHLASEYLALS